MSLHPNRHPGLKRTSTRTQMIVGTVTILTFVLILFGVFTRYVVTTTLMESVDEQLMERTDHAFRPGPPPGGFDHGPFSGSFGPPPAAGQNGQYPGNPPNQTGPGLPAPYFNGPAEGPPGSNAPPPNNGPGNPYSGFTGPPRFNDDNSPPDGGPMPNVRQPSQRTDEDPYRPRQFDRTGKSLDPFNKVVPWDIRDVLLASNRGHAIYSTILYNGSDLRILTRPHLNRDGGNDLVQTAYPLAEVNNAIGAVDRALVILIPVALIVAALGGAFVTKSVFDRVGQMVKSTTNIRASDLSQRLPVSGSDEFAELAETFNDLISRVESAFTEQARIVEQQRRFTADASHELKTPLTVIRGTTSLALSGSGTLDRQATVDIDDAAELMSELVQDLIYLARADAGQLLRENIEILLLEPLQRAIARIAKLTSTPITLKLIDESVEVSADESELTRLFTNILQNAVQHTSSDGTVRVELSSTDQHAVVRIVDTGTGIPARHIPHLFERFYRVDDARSRGQGGSGLGLSISKGIVDSHNGTIQITSREGRGTQVTITLPRL